MKNKTLLIVALIMAGAVLFTVAFNAAKSEDYKNWRSTDGVVTCVSGPRKFRMQVHYDYTVDGEQLSAWESIHIRRGMIPDVGEGISVWYDTDNAARTSLSKPELSLLDSIAPVFIAIPLSLSVILNERRRNT